MKFLNLTLFFSLQFVFRLSFAQQQNETITAEKIINKAVAAMGGKEYLQTIKTLYTDISTEMDGRPVHWITKEMLPNKGAFRLPGNQPLFREIFLACLSAFCVYSLDRNTNGEGCCAFCTNQRSMPNKTAKADIMFACCCVCVYVILSGVVRIDRRKI